MKKKSEQVINQMDGVAEEPSSLLVEAGEPSTSDQASPSKKSEADTHIYEPSTSEFKQAFSEIDPEIQEKMSNLLRAEFKYMSV